MALAARARGTSAQLAGKAETTIGTAATGNFARLPAITFDLTPSRPLAPDPVVSQGYGRNPAPTFPDKLSVSGTAVVPLDTGNIDFWAALMFGAVVTSGTTLDTYTAGGTPTAASFEKAFLDVSDYWLYTGVQADGFTLNFSPLGTPVLSVKLVGRAAGAMGVVTNAGTVTTATYSPIRSAGATLLIAGAAVGNITGGNLSFAQNLDPIYTMDAVTTGGVSEFDAGLMSGGGSITARYDGVQIDTLARAGTVATLGVSYPITGGFALGFNFGQVKFETVSPPISGPAGIEQTAKFTAEYDGNPTYFFTLTRSR